MVVKETKVGSSRGRMLHPSSLDTPGIGYNRFVLTTYRTDSTIGNGIENETCIEMDPKVYVIDY